jgi:formate dehydrogenase subunit delta
VTEVAEHVRKFWDPRMKRRLFDLVDSEAGQLEPVALAAAALLR